jgi:hypothetical protein
MNTFRTAIIAGFIPLLISSCEKTPNTTVIGSGNLVSKEVVVPAFDGVSITGTCNVEIVIGEPQQVELTAQQQVLDVMTYEVKNRILELGFKPGVTVNTDKEISASIVIPEVSYAAVTGAGNFTLSGDPQEKLDIYITGTGNVYAFDMVVADCFVNISGVATCELNLSSSLDVQISGVGHIFYRGDPQVTSQISGVGELTHVEP